MRIKFLSVENYSMVDVLTRLEEVISSTTRNLRRDKGVDVKDTVLSEVVVTVGIIPEGGSYDEPQMLSVEHHEGYPEMFEWIIDMEEGRAVSNEDDSFISEQHVAVASGKTPDFKEVESVYDADDLTLEDVTNLDQYRTEAHAHKDGFKVIKYFKDGKLIQELKATPKEGSGETSGE